MHTSKLLIKITNRMPIFFSNIFSCITFLINIILKNKKLKESIIKKLHNIIYKLFCLTFDKNYNK